ncbi:anaerobic ribonucleoside-triphosphate reductase activating protein [bacterium]|nr:anaerobic ribonucleoside-triphosphate reductase activating protein [candidate division CSSED10-310 bacterium]
MRIGGLEPFTLSDYPGKVAAVVFTQGCNFRCPFCHNSSLLEIEHHQSQKLSCDDVCNFFRKRKHQLDGIVISGGEPTLQNNLTSFLITLKDMGYFIKLDTNGSNPKALIDLISKRLLDYIAMDVKAPLEKYEILSGTSLPYEKIKQSIKIISESNIEHVFRTTFVPPLLSDEDILSIKSMIPKNSPYIVQPFIKENALDKTLAQP